MTQQDFISKLSQAYQIMDNEKEMCNPNIRDDAYLCGYMSAIRAIVDGMNFKRFTHESTPHELAEYLWGEEITKEAE